jgi:hypothetical protein
MGEPNFKFFGLVIGAEIEFGYFLASELWETGVVRDPNFRPCRLNDFIIRLLGRSWEGIAAF